MNKFIDNYTQEELEYYISQALDEAKNAYDKGEIPIGALIINSKTKKIITSAFNQVETKNNPLEHAELIVIKEACNIINSKYLNEFDIFVSLEPCPMCATAIAFAKMNSLYFGAFNNNNHASYGGKFLFTEKRLNHIPNIKGGILEQQCSEIIKSFFKQNCR